MKIIDKGILTLLFGLGLVVANFLMKRYFPEFLCAFICRYDTTNLLSVYIRFGSKICQALIGFDSGMCRPNPPHLVLCWTWFGLESVSGRPTYVRYITDLRLTNHLPSVAELRPTRPPTLPDKTDTTPTYIRQTTDNLLGRDLSNMFERSLPDKFVCPNINWHQTDKTESILTVNRSLPECDDFCWFEVSFVSVWPVWLGY